MKINVNNPIFEFLGTFADFVGLNIVFLITCLPVFTIGPSLCALYTVTLREARNEHGYMISTYFRAWKANFKSGVALFFIYLLAGAILLFNLAFWLKMKSTSGNIITLIMAGVLIIYVMSFIYVFALNARFENTIRQTIKNALLIPFTSLGLSLCMLAILALSVVLTWFAPIIRVFMVIFGIAFIAYCESFLLVKVFQRFEPEEEQHEESEENKMSKATEI